MKFLPLLFLADALLLQWLGGAYASGFGGHPDEAAHFVSSVMVHDFLIHPGAGHPMAFAQQFYLHYPKVAIGNWPPLLHGLLALWYLVFGVSRASALVLMAVFAALTATLMAYAGRRLLSPSAGWFAGGVYLALPLVQESATVVMTEHLVTLLILAGTLAFARFARSRRSADALLFGVLASAAILTRGSAWALALVPPIVIVLTGDWRLLRNWRLWLAALVVGVLCVPWYVATRGMAPNAMVGIDPGAPAAFFRQAAAFFPLAAFHAIGLSLALLAALGVWRALLKRQPDAGRRPAEWPALAAMCIGVLLIQCLVPAGIESRYMLQLLPAVLLFAAAGLEWLSTFGARHVLWAVASVVILLTVFHLPDAMRNSGYDRVAGDLAGQATPTLLLISDARGEGSMIAAVALRDHRPHTLALRGSKLLVSEDWLGRASHPRFADAPAMRAMLDAIPVNAVMIDHAIEPAQARAYHQQIEQLIKSHPEDWRLFASYDITRYGRLQARAVEVYLRRDHGAQAVNLAYVGRLMQRN
ncbi:hypothetical protein GJ697_25190 [Pseudoduganella sp. FT25W]|uniref:Glycosyltransferase RgtA/B/C/D-like domain-containing protein n=1 Tax=Duganella alba TaxID=2666081 RepID=A0A6L5QMT3_9BURK|nr:glycosyltransferase family 39 protein [Duganella alba]MRX11124.1 hypothetical protein [Duganella alba]MRX19253.1 hypothetical protein [Duganella alba]